MKKIVVANWKMNPATVAEATDILDFLLSNIESESFRKINLIVCPPFIYIDKLSDILSGHDEISLGAQDTFWEQEGAYTGEVSPLMLKNQGVRYVISGHSERRWIIGESDETINEETKAILQNELVPILAIGEKKRDENYKEFLINQIKVSLSGMSELDVAKIIFAYEPVWAIGTGENDDPENANETIRLIKKTINSFYPSLEINDIPVLYGGSVNSGNILDFINKEQINGVLIGGASVDKKEFTEIVRKITEAI